MKVKCKQKEVAVTIDGQRYVAKDGIITVDDAIGNRIIKKFPDWGKASPRKSKKEVAEDGKVYQ